LAERISNNSGLYYPDGSFRSTEQIRRDLAFRGELPAIIYNSSSKLPRDADEHLAIASKVSKQYKELSPQSENFVEVTIQPNSIISMWGDLHLWNQETHHDRVRQELEVIRNTPNSLVILGADLVDGIHWGGEGGGEQAASLTEQQQTMWAIFQALRGKIIIGVSGEHDSKWQMRTGGDPYAVFTELSGAPYIKGVGEVLIHCGEIDYKLVVQHKARGYSMYNKNHPTYREARFELQDADIYINFHTHKKQVSQETIRKFGRADVITHISAGAYKPTDGYGQREGFVGMLPEQMYGASIMLYGDKKRVDVDFDILSAHEKWGL